MLMRPRGYSILKSIQLIKDGMPKEVECKGCGKAFPTNFETEYCYDCRKNMKR